MFELNSSLIFIFGFLLAALNYYLGLFLGSAPLPKKIRATGWVMVEDAVTYTVLLVICATPPIVLQIFSAIGFGNIDAMYEQVLYPWLGVKSGWIIGTGMLSLLLNGFVQLALIIFMMMFINILIQAGLRMIILSIQGLTSTIPDLMFKSVRSVGVVVGGILGVYISYRTVQYAPFLAMIPLSWFSLYAIYYLAEFVRMYWPSMMGLGALIFGTPFRIGRRLGASLIAISLVFYLGLPLMPYFIEPASNISSAGESVAKLQAELQRELDAANIWGDPSVWPTTQDQPLNMSYETRSRQPVSGIGEAWNYINHLFSVAIGTDSGNMSNISPTLDPPAYVKRVAVPEGFAEFAFYALILPNIYVWVILITISAGLAKILAGKGIL